MRWMIGDAKRRFDDQHYPFGGPEIADKAKGVGSTSEECGDMLTLLRGQFWRGASMRLGTQRLTPSTRSRAFKPLADGAFTHTQRGCDILLFPALLV